MNLNNIKLVISEVDGIITEGLTGFGELNTPMFKQFNMKDFEAINLIKKNWGFVFISTDAAINASMCKRRNIPFYFAERSKKEVYGHITQRFSVLPDNVLYVGTTYSDIDCLRMSGFSICPEDSVPQVKNVSDYVVPMYSGTGVLCYVYELLREAKIKADRDE